MIAVLFEVFPAPGQMDTYLVAAERLRADLNAIDGFISIERFASLSAPGKLLSLSYWRDEAAIGAWRNFESHRSTQALGRGSIFADYRLCVANVVRDYGMHSRVQAPKDSLAAHREIR